MYSIIAFYKTYCNAPVHCLIRQGILNRDLEELVAVAGLKDNERGFLSEKSKYGYI